MCIRDRCKEELYKTAEDAIKNLATIPVLYNGGAIELNDYLDTASAYFKTLCVSESSGDVYKRQLYRAPIGAINRLSFNLLN